MRFIIWWIRSLFCDHDWELEEMRLKIIDWSFNLISGRNEKNVIGDRIKVSATCKKCGWHRSYNKF